MRTEQKKILAGWLGAFLFIALLSFFDKQIQENWAMLKWPSLLVILVIAAFAQKPNQSAVNKGRENINDIVNTYPLIKFYMALYCLGSAFYCLYAVSNNKRIELEFIPFALAIFGIMLPAFIIQQYKLFKNAGR